MELSKYIGKKIKFYRELKNFTQDDLAEHLNTTRQSISRYENGERKANQDILFDLADIFEVSVDDFFPEITSKKKEFLIKKTSSIMKNLNTNRQESVCNFAAEQLQEQKYTTEEDIVVFPSKKLINGRSTAAGSPLNGESQDNEASTMIVEYAEIPSGADEIVTIAGDSMEPILKEGSQAFIHWQPDIENGEIGVVAIEDEGITCKRVCFDYENDEIILVSLNDKYEDMIYPIDKVRIIGKVL